jgi:hypothetical protein
MRLPTIEELEAVASGTGPGLFHPVGEGLVTTREDAAAVAWVMRRREIAEPELVTLQETCWSGRVRL